jgi:hypothetical protein
LGDADFDFFGVHFTITFLKRNKLSQISIGKLTNP